MNNNDKFDKFVDSLMPDELSLLDYTIRLRLDKDIVSLYEKYKDDNEIVRLPYDIFDIKSLMNKDGMSLVTGFKLHYFFGESDKSNYTIMKVYNDGSTLVMDNDIKFKIIEMFANEEQDEFLKKKATDGCYFNNEDIIITDPCYLFNNEQWENSDHCFSLEKIGIKNYISLDTIYGDWSCTTFNTDTNKVIGEFCADAGKVCVVPLNEIVKISDRYNDIKDKAWTRTIIKGFTGHVYADYKTDKGIYDDDTEYHKKGEKWSHYYVEIVGEGNINFRTKQTGL